MRPFTDKEIEYLQGQRLGRLATAGSDGSPHIVPVGFRLDAEAQAIEIGGHGLSKSKKWRDLQAKPASRLRRRRPGQRRPVDPSWDRDPRPRRTPRRRRRAALRRWWLGLGLVHHRAAADHQLGDRRASILRNRAQRPHHHNLITHLHARRDNADAAGLLLTQGRGTHVNPARTVRYAISGPP
jgi:hypothetical protein